MKYKTTKKVILLSLKEQFFIILIYLTNSWILNDICPLLRKISGAAAAAPIFYAYITSYSLKASQI